MSRKTIRRRNKSRKQKGGKGGLKSINVNGQEYSVGCKFYPVVSTGANSGTSNFSQQYVPGTSTQMQRNQSSSMSPAAAAAAGLAVGVAGAEAYENRDEIAQGIEDAADYVKDGAEDAYDYASESASNAYDSTSDDASDFAGGFGFGGRIKRRRNSSKKRKSKKQRGGGDDLVVCCNETDPNNKTCTKSKTGYCMSGNKRICKWSDLNKDEGITNQEVYRKAPQVSENGSGFDTFIGTGKYKIYSDLYDCNNPPSQGGKNKKRSKKRKSSKRRRSAKKN